MTPQHPQIPQHTIENWQRIVNLIARLADVPASLVMRTNAQDHAVFVASRTEAHPYDPGLRFALNDRLYCSSVLSDGALAVEDAARDPRWADNDDLKYGMSFYLGYALHWPDGSVFGMICVLDTHRNPKALLFREGLQEFSRVIESDLRLLVEVDRRAALERELQTTLDQLESRVKRRTTDLEEANAALRVLLASIETARREYDANILRQIRGLAIPLMVKLRARLGRDAASAMYLNMLEDNLKSLTASMSGELTRAFEALTPAEQEIAQMIMRGQTTKDIARTLSRETSTIEFHRNNIRKKMGLCKSGRSLRSALRAAR